MFSALAFLLFVWIVIHAELISSPSTLGAMLMLMLHHNVRVVSFGCLDWPFIEHMLGKSLLVRLRGEITSLFVLIGGATALGRQTCASKCPLSA